MAEAIREAVKDECRDLLQGAVTKPERSLVEELREMCAENPYACYQCGTCSAGCPYIEEMDLTPDEVIRHVVMDKKEVLGSKTIWLCSSCYTCAERCPRDLNITKIMEALRQIVLRKNVDATSIPCIAEEKRRGIPQIAFVCLFRKNIG
ncbi:MAG: 4Fe-4S dicluster domain-containing protein [Candidatus Thermoplasmatota archaeon]